MVYHFIQGLLKLRFTDDTPLVSEYTVTANFEADRQGIKMNCTIPKIEDSERDCKLLILL